MTNSEFSNQFDVLYNNVMSNQAPGLDEYEKSVFLTLSQEQLVLAYYNGLTSPRISFEITEEMRRYLSSLVKTSEIEPDTDVEDLVTISEDSQVFDLPENLWFITYESAKLGDSDNTCSSGRTIEVIPVTQDDYYRINENPFKGPSLRRALRLDIADNKVELVSKYTIDKYLVRYVEKLSPIILTDLSDYDVTIGGSDEETECKLNSCVHRAILEGAVELARQAMGRTFEKYQNNNQ